MLFLLNRILQQKNILFLELGLHDVVKEGIFVTY